MAEWLVFYNNIRVFFLSDSTYFNVYFLSIKKCFVSIAFVNLITTINNQSDIE